MKRDVSSYISGKVQDKGQRFTIYDDIDGPFRSEYHSINTTMTLF